LRPDVVEKDYVLGAAEKSAEELATDAFGPPASDAFVHTQVTSIST
jgi:hypothetical protein